MFEYFNSILCVQSKALYTKGAIVKGVALMSKSSYKSKVHRGQIRIVRRGCRGTLSLVSWISVSRDKHVKDLVINSYGDPRERLQSNELAESITMDSDAASFISSQKKANGRSYTGEAQRLLVMHASILNAIGDIASKRIAMRKSKGGNAAGVWDAISENLNRLNREEYPHKLPKNSRSLKERYNRYDKNGYGSLIHGGTGNNNSRKVTVKLENLILSIYAMPEKPYTVTVREMYMQFMGGAFDLVDQKTGVMYDREDFMKDGIPLAVSDSTVWNYIRNLKNDIAVSKKRNGQLEFNSVKRPHHNRKTPDFSLSKISMDDRDLPRKMHDGKRVKAYYSYDVASGCVIGASYSKDKDRALFVDCMRDMLRFCNDNGFGVPMEVEVEHHIVNLFKNDLMQAGTVFPFVRWCNAGNSQEKHAEHLNKSKKYGYEKRYQQGIGRFYLKLEANRPKIDKTWDADGMKEKTKTFFYEELVADDKMTIEKYNNDLHPNQKKYAGMTRMEVLKYTLNPNLVAFDQALMAKYIGDKRNTSIRRSQYVVVQYEKYQLPSPEVLKYLRPNNLEVVAHWIPGLTGEIDTVYLYQDSQFICECHKIVAYNTSRAEWTDDDATAYKDQSKYVAEFDLMTKEDSRELAKIKEIANTENHDAIDLEIVEAVQFESAEDQMDRLMREHEDNDRAKSAIDRL